jgi:trehalose 6-phosphate phosphatase
MDIAAPPQSPALGLALGNCAFLLDVDGTILDIASSPRQVWVPADLRRTLSRLAEATGGAVALVSGRSINDIDLIFSPLQFAAIGVHGAEMRLSGEGEVRPRIAPLKTALKRKLATVGELGPGILVEDKGYSLALHYRLAPRAEKVIHEAISLIRGDLPDAAIEVLPGKCVFEIKRSGFTKATGVRELMRHPPFNGRKPLFMGDDVTDESVFAIMPDMDGLAFSVGRRVKGVAGHFDAPSDVREFLAHLADNEVT